MVGGGPAGVASSRAWNGRQSTTGRGLGSVEITAREQGLVDGRDAARDDDVGSEGWARLSRWVAGEESAAATW